MPSARPNDRVRARRDTLCRRKAALGQAHTAFFAGANRPGTLHPVRPVHPFCRGGGRRPGDRLRLEERFERGRGVPGPAFCVELQRQRRANMPRRGFVGQAVPLQGASLGPRTGRDDMHILRRRLPGGGAVELGPGSAFPGCRQRPGQLGLALRQRALLFRSSQQPRPAGLSPGAQGRWWRPRQQERRFAGRVGTGELVGSVRRNYRASSRRARGQDRHYRRRSPTKRRRLCVGQVGTDGPADRQRRRATRRRATRRTRGELAEGDDRPGMCRPAGGHDGARHQRGAARPVPEAAPCGRRGRGAGDRIELGPDGAVFGGVRTLALSPGRPRGSGQVPIRRIACDRSRWRGASGRRSSVFATR